MAMSVAGGGGRGGRRRGRRSTLLSEINVTPFVDVMLVLLIVFMVAAPMMTVGVPIELPQSQARELDTQTQPVTITVTPAGEVFLGEEQVAIESLIARVSEAAASGLEERIFLRGDSSASYGTVMRVMGLLSGAGYTRIGLITEQEQVQ